MRQTQTNIYHVGIHKTCHMKVIFERVWHHVLDRYFRVFLVVCNEAVLIFVCWYFNVTFSCKKLFCTKCFHLLIVARLSFLINNTSNKLNKHLVFLINCFVLQISGRRVHWHREESRILVWIKYHGWLPNV